MSRVSSLPAIGALVLALAGCHARGRTQEPRIDDPEALAAKLEKHLRRHPDDDVAWRDLAHVQWMHLGRTEKAIPTLDRLAKRGDVVAMASRMLVAESRREREVVLRLGYALVEHAARSRDELAIALGEVAARRISSVHGDEDGDDERFVRFWQRIAGLELPAGVRQPLTSLRAQIARRRGEDYAKFYRDEGCVQSWQVGPLLGTQGELELAAEPGPFVVDERAQLAKLACVVRVWNPEPRSGIRRLRSWLDVRGKTLRLEIGAQESIRVRVDGRPIHRTDVLDRFPASRTTFELEVEPGVHELEVATSIPQDRAWLMVRATDADGRGIAASVKPGAKATPAAGKPEVRNAPWPRELGELRGPISEPLRLLLALDDALDDADSDRAEGWAGALARFERFGEGAHARALFERADPSRGRTVSLSREQAALDRALAIDPALDAARARKLEIMLERGDEAAVIDALADLPAARLRDVSGELLRHRAHLTHGDEHKADQALARAAKLAPKSCKVVLSQRNRARDRDDVRGEDERTAALSHCSGSHEIRARLAERRGRHDEARKLWTEVIRRTPDDLEAIEAAARLAVLAGDRAEAERLLARVLELNPLRVAAHVARADLAVANRELPRAREDLRAALAKIPHSTALREAGEGVGITDDLERLRVDGLAAWRDYKAAGKSYEGVSEVLVLDRSSVWIHDNGGQRQIVHLVVHLLSKDALDRYGEISVPDGARLLTLRSIKPDGSVVEAELVPGKEGLSLRDLAVGDAVDYEFLLEREPSYGLPGYLDVSSFRFQSLDIPYHQSELLIAHPKGMAVREDRRNDPPAPKRDAMMLDGKEHTTALWRARQVPRKGVEPGVRALLDELPSVRVYTELDLPAYVRGISLQVRRSQRANPELRALARRLTRGKPGARERVQALWSWVVENVEDGGDLSAGATGTLAARTGSRLMLLRTLLREAGVRAELWLARDAFGPKDIAGGHPLIESYDAAMLAVRLPDLDEPLMVLTASKVLPLGYLSPGYSGSRALRVPLDERDGKPGVVDLPRSPAELADRRLWDLQVELDRSGSAVVRGKITLSGMEAVAWRQGLRDIDRDRVREAFQQAELGWLRGATLRDLEIHNERALAQPLVLEFVADAPDLGISQGGALSLPSSIVPLNQGSTYTSLPRRVTGIVVPYAPVREVRVAFEIEGARFAEVPEAEKITSSFGSFERSVTEGGVGKNRVVLQMRSTLRTGVVEPSGYEDLAGFTRKVEAAERALLRAR